uniref:Uncharacterized protein n=1 Tax=Arundo donax TaxID=35708 RepID=A0A0A9B9B5_ARUDO
MLSCAEETKVQTSGVVTD